jgi:transcriptional regulator GlxA family with amidase domain
MADRLVDPIFIRDGKVSTAVGITSALDLALPATTSLPLPGIATRYGFAPAETLRLAFVGRYGIPPPHYRARHGTA